MKIKDEEVLGLIPARGDSKSIPLKNIVMLNGHPLLAYVINAGKRSRWVKRLICSTDNEKIAEVCTDLGVEVMHRPKELALDHTPVVDVALDLLESLEKVEDYFPFAVVLLQPTSPFVLPEHIDRCVDLLKGNDHAGSAQTVTEFPHNYHAYNQRVIEDGVVRFRFSEERMTCYNKQTKPKFYIFGNVLVTRTEALFQERDLFAYPSLAYRVSSSYALDVDGPEDLELAEWYIQKGKVRLPEFKVS